MFGILLKKLFSSRRKRNNNNNENVSIISNEPVQIVNVQVPKIEESNVIYDIMNLQLKLY